ncbi:hypothetical protein CDD82_4365 [Ophiocordyceps australis]|uniref:Uncharacterized protein n=1 Tax=Ophiocordyceps australis TaxID=1399860 RepID=A0A2C5Z712_9HYPO|nr:hypothetical protein CDD82_4365 [Ophiocordyceps australis]
MPRRPVIEEEDVVEGTPAANFAAQIPLPDDEAYEAPDPSYAAAMAQKARQQQRQFGPSGPDDTDEIEEEEDEGQARYSWHTPDWTHIFGRPSADRRDTSRIGSTTASKKSPSF